MKITNPITLDVARSNSYICLLAKQFDENSRFLIATLTNNGAPMIIPAGAAVTLRATRPDGEPVAVPGIINNDGTTTVEIDDYILEVVGSASLSIEVAIGDEILTSASFNLTIQRADGNGWLRVYVAAANLAAGNYYITIGDTPYAFTTTQAIPAGGSVYFASEGGTAQTRDASGNVLDASLTLTAGTSGTELTSDVPTMSFLTAIAGRMATIEAEMSQKANIDGSYPLLNAGTADNLIADTGATQAIPFIQEGTGKGNGEATVKAGGVLQLKKKLGNTVCVNQLVDSGTTSVTIPSGEKYYAVINGTASIGTSNGTAIAVTGGTDIFINLSLWFGSTSAIPSHLLSHPEDWGKYYSGSLAYDAGHLENADGTVLKSVGRNCFDEQMELGSISSVDGSNQSSTTTLRSVNYIPVIPNTDYYFYAPHSTTSDYVGIRYYDASKNYVDPLSLAYPGQVISTPPNVYFMRFVMLAWYGTAYKHDITISLYYSGESGYDEYYPYTVLAEVDTGSEGLHGDGTEANSDVKLPSGEITRKRDRVDMGTLTYQLNTGLTGVDRFRVINCAPIKSCSASNTPSLKCVKFVASDMVTANAQFAVWVVGQDLKDIYFYTPAGTYAGADAFKTAMSGIYLDFPLATPTTEQGTAFPENIPCDPNGTLSWTQSAGVPQGNEIFYPVDLKGDLESIVAAIPSANGTYTLHATVTTAGVTFSWS